MIVIYECNMFIVQASGASTEARVATERNTSGAVVVTRLMLGLALKLV
jgi:hypothetical protein